jgi:hypothetical protein
MASGEFSVSDAMPPAHWLPAPERVPMTERARLQMSTCEGIAYPMLGNILDARY